MICPAEAILADGAPTATARAPSVSAERPGLSVRPSDGLSVRPFGREGWSVCQTLRLAAVSDRKARGGVRLPPVRAGERLDPNWESVSHWRWLRMATADCRPHLILKCKQTPTGRGRGVTWRRRWSSVGQVGERLWCSADRYRPVSAVRQDRCRILDGASAISSAPVSDAQAGQL